MNRRRVLVELALATSLIVFLACDTRPSPNWSFDRDVGLAYLTQERSCLVSRAADLQRDTQVQLVDPVSGRSGSAVILGPLEACATPVVDESAGHGYELRVEDERLATPFVGIAASGPIGAIARRDGITSTDLDADGQPEFLRSCTSNEGVHVTIWSEAPLTGTRRWHGYFYLGYDVTPTCTEKETAPA